MDFGFRMVLGIQGLVHCSPCSKKDGSRTVTLSFEGMGNLWNVGDVRGWGFRPIIFAAMSSGLPLTPQVLTKKGTRAPRALYSRYLEG